MSNTADPVTVLRQRIALWRELERVLGTFPELPGEINRVLNQLDALPTGREGDSLVTPPDGVVATPSDPLPSNLGEK